MTFVANAVELGTFRFGCCLGLKGSQSRVEKHEAEAGGPGKGAVPDAGRKAKCHHDARKVPPHT